MKIKKWFSFLEILIVIMIVGILLVTFRSSFQIKNKDVLYGQACIETIYGEVNNFLHAAVSSKSVNSWGEQIFPSTYIITFDPLRQRIDLWYETSWTFYSLYRSISMTGESNNYCSSSSYTIVMHGDTYQIYINKWLQRTQERAFFFLSGINLVSTGANIFLQCDSVGTGCKTLARFETDIRTINLKKQMCLNVATTGDCLEWDN